MKVEVRCYGFPEQVGYKRWVCLESGIVFERLNGELVVIER